MPLTDRLPMVAQHNKEKTEKISNYQPNRDLERFCYALVSEDIKGNKTAAQRLSKVDRCKFEYAWRTKPEFRKWYSDLCFTVLSKNSAIPAYALLGAIINKDVQAIRTFYELEGRLNKGGIANMRPGGGPIIQLVVKFPDEPEVASCLPVIETVALPISEKIKIE